MIVDPQRRQDFESQWATIRKFCRSSHRQFMAGGVYINETPPEEFFNLPLVLAYALLDEVLAELIGQGVFVCSPRGKAPALLGAKMSASKGALPWIDYAAVEAGKEARNELAHQGKLLPRQECFRLIDLIGAELVAWSVLARN